MAVRLRGKGRRGGTGAVVDISIAGGPELNRKLRTLNRKLQRKIIVQSLRKAAKRHVKPAIDAELAKISPGEFGTGRLRTLGSKVLALRRKDTKSRNTFGIKVMLPTRGDLDIGPNDAYYPAVLEFGSVERNIRPRRYMRTARDKSASAADRTIARELKRKIEAEVTRLGRLKAGIAGAIAKGFNR